VAAHTAKRKDMSERKAIRDAPGPHRGPLAAGTAISGHGVSIEENDSLDHVA